MNQIPGYEAFMATADEATKAKYAAELAHHGDEWKKALDYDYADWLSMWGLLDRRIEPLYSGKHPRGCRIWFRKPPESSLPVAKNGDMQTGQQPQ